MEVIFLNIVQAVSDSRFWLMPLLVGCVFVCCVVEVFRGVQGEIEGLRNLRI